MTRGGQSKPGASSSGSDLYNLPKNVNMGADNDNQKNPLSMLLSAAKNTLGGGGK